jgi:hypothetical protein
MLEHEREHLMPMPAPFVNGGQDPRFSGGEDADLSRGVLSAAAVRQMVEGPSGPVHVLQPVQGS